MTFYVAILRWGATVVLGEMMMRCRAEGDPKWTSTWSAFQDEKEPSEQVCQLYDCTPVCEPMHLLMTCTNHVISDMVSLSYEYLKKEGLEKANDSISHTGQAKRFTQEVDRWVDAGCKKPVEIRMPR